MITLTSTTTIRRKYKVLAKGQAEAFDILIDEMHAGGKCPYTASFVSEEVGKPCIGFLKCDVEAADNGRK